MGNIHALLAALTRNKGHGRGILTLQQHCTHAVMIALKSGTIGG
jgi:hypothetical protein